MRKYMRSLEASASTHRLIRLPKIKTRKPTSKDDMPTATLHSGLSNSKTTIEPTANVPIHAHQATNSAFPKLMSINILGRLGDYDRVAICICTEAITSAAGDSSNLPSVRLRLRTGTFVCH